MERALLIEELKKGTFDMMVHTEYRSPIGDPGPGWEMCLKTGGSLNFSRYSNPEFDKLLKQINSETNKAKRKQLFAHGMAMLDQTAPLYLIGFTDHLPMWRNTVKGHASDSASSPSWGAWTRSGWTGSARSGRAGLTGPADRRAQRPGRPGGGAAAEPMRKYLAQRLLIAVPTLLGVTLLIFLAMRVLPGDPLSAISGEGGGSYVLNKEQLDGGAQEPGPGPTLRRPVPGLAAGHRAGRSGKVVLARRAHPRADLPPRAHHRADRGHGDAHLLDHRPARGADRRHLAELVDRLRLPARRHALHGHPQLLGRAHDHPVAGPRPSPGGRR